MKQELIHELFEKFEQARYDYKGISPLRKPTSLFRPEGRRSRFVKFWGIEE